MPRKLVFIGQTFRASPDNQYGINEEYADSLLVDRCEFFDFSFGAIVGELIDRVTIARTQILNVLPEHPTEEQLRQFREVFRLSTSIGVRACPSLLVIDTRIVRAHNQFTASGCNNARFINCMAGDEEVTAPNPDLDRGAGILLEWGDDAYIENTTFDDMGYGVALEGFCRRTVVRFTRFLAEADKFYLSCINGFVGRQIAVDPEHWNRPLRSEDLVYWIDARLCWWSHKDGPRGVGPNPNPAAAEAGVGTLFDPWLTEDPQVSGRVVTSSPELNRWIGPDNRLARFLRGPERPTYRWNADNPLTLS